jgi:hypothetical protein
MDHVQRRPLTEAEYAQLRESWLARDARLRANARFGMATAGTAGAALGAAIVAAYPAPVMMQAAVAGGVLGLLSSGWWYGLRGRRNPAARWAVEQGTYDFGEAVDVDLEVADAAWLVLPEGGTAWFLALGDGRLLVLASPAVDRLQEDYHFPHRRCHWTVSEEGELLGYDGLEPFQPVSLPELDDEHPWFDGGVAVPHGLVCEGELVTAADDVSHAALTTGSRVERLPVPVAAGPSDVAQAEGVTR